jgi:hypothetical protein
MESNYAVEIIELHQFFQEYFTEILPAKAISRFDQTLGAGFTLIESSGKIMDYDTIKQGIRQLHGQRQGLRIWIENIMLRQELSDLLIATYEEWQEINEQKTQRACTVVFLKDEDAPNGLMWLHVHESGLHEVS